MIVCYALGGGLGHITRARALLHTLGKGAEPVTALVSSPQALDPRALGHWSALLAPPEATSSPKALGDWVASTLGRLKPQALYVDAFPGGILGDLCGRRWPPGMQRFHAARRLRWQVYRRRLAGDLPFYERTYVLEPLEDAHRAVLGINSEYLEGLEVQDPPEALRAPTTEAAGGKAPVQRGAWLVVHSGPAAEINHLVAYAADLRRQEGSVAPLVLVAPASPPNLLAGLIHVDRYPAWPLFPSATRIVTACGWNAMRQTALLRDRHHFLPFPRSLDDQFERAACRLRQRATAGGRTSTGTGAGRSSTRCHKG
ncbi:MAG TPA: hypothetical protein VMW75_08970 [Thermoanaerobaculia bacterium]|nr:hypothetical protein [Thermoanaerobaculia bacterium]